MRQGPGSLTVIPLDRALGAHEAADFLAVDVATVREVAAPKEHVPLLPAGQGQGKVSRQLLLGTGQAVDIVIGNQYVQYQQCCENRANRYQHENRCCWKLIHHAFALDCFH